MDRLIYIRSIARNRRVGLEANAFLLHEEEEFFFVEVLDPLDEVAFGERFAGLTPREGEAAQKQRQDQDWQCPSPGIANHQCLLRSMGTDPNETWADYRGRMQPPQPWIPTKPGGSLQRVLSARG